MNRKQPQPKPDGLIKPDPPPAPPRIACDRFPPDVSLEEMNAVKKRLTEINEMQSKISSELLSIGVKVYRMKDARLNENEQEYWRKVLDNQDFIVSKIREYYGQLQWDIDKGEYGPRK